MTQGEVRTHSPALATERVSAAAGGKRLAWIEWVRGCAAVLVMLAHYLSGVIPAFHDFSRSTLDVGRIGVVAFFLVSGFVIPLSYRRQTTSVFIVCRATRLFPIYWIVLAVTVIFFYPSADWTSAAWWGQLLLNGTMFQQLLGASIITVAWTLTIEMVYYLQQIFFKTVKLLDLSWVLSYFWAAVFVTMIAAEHILARELPISFPMLLAVSCLGHAACLVQEKLLPMRHAIVMTIIVVGSITLAGALRSDYDPLWPPRLYVLSFLGGLAFFLLAYLLRNRVDLPWAVWLGSISYALYLAHAVTGGFIRSAPQQLLWPAFFASVASAVLFAWLLHAFIEKPFIRIGRTYRPSEKASGA
jgi:peptidoglycan/LPS O-acetylase OafA/YrhL